MRVDSMVGVDTLIVGELYEPYKQSMRRLRRKSDETPDFQASQ